MDEFGTALLKHKWLSNCESLVPGDLYVMFNHDFDYSELRLLLSRDDDAIGYLVVKPGSETVSYQRTGLSPDHSNIRYKKILFMLAPARNIANYVLVDIMDICPGDLYTLDPSLFKSGNQLRLLVYRTGDSYGFFSGGQYYTARIYPGIVDVCWHRVA